MIAILDFGSQYTQLIARRLREQKIYCEIFPHTLSALQLKAYVREIKGIILSGGPQSVYQTGSPGLNDNIFKFGIPVLGICYGMQYITHRLGGKVTKAKRQEYGFAGINIMKKGIIFDGLPERFNVWMSHGDALQNLPHSFTPLASTQNCKYASVADIKRKIYGLQFHPEVEHTQYGKVILGNFAKKICKEKAQWRFSSFIREKVKEIRETVKNERVILALSGGVDSSVCAVLLHRALGRRISCVFVDNGCLRKGESAEVENFFRKVLKNHLIHIDAGKTFLKALKGITDPELKRKITGKTFIDVFEKTARKIGNIKFLAQGTLYPDWIESTQVKGPSSSIKSHHNVGGLPGRMKLKLIEPLKYLFKDEVRKLGRQLGISEKILNRQPFPGPGLAIRIIGEITQERLRILREADKIVQEETGGRKNIWQSFAVLVPVKTVGVMGDKRTYENLIALRVVQSRDGMTADWVKLPQSLLCRLSNRLINEVKGVNRVVYDISSKPPATIEWE